MKKYLSRLTWSILATILALTGNSCSDNDEDPFAGTDNYIASFVLKNGNQSVKALISDETIVMSVPIDFQLINATAEVKISENSSIKPSPESITDWSSEYVFVVTAYNGKTRSYRYTPEDKESTENSTVLLTSQEEVDAFGARGVSTINGNLIIGTASGTDHISTLEPLNKLREVSNGVIIKGAFSGETLGGLNSLEKIGGMLRIETSGLKEAVFPALKSAMHIEVASKSLESISCPKIAEINGSLNFAVTVLKEVSMPKLEKVVGDVYFSVPKQRDPSVLEHISFPSLKKVEGRFAFGESNLLKTISLPELTLAGSLTFGINSLTPDLTEISLPKLERTNGEIRYHQLTQITSIDLPSLTYLGGDLITYFCYTERINLPKLETVKGNIILNNIGDLEERGLGGFEKLNSLGGELFVGYSLRTTLSQLSLPPQLKNFKTLNLLDCNTLQTLDVTNHNIDHLKLQRSTIKGLTIKGNQTFSGTITLNGEGSSFATAPYKYTFPIFSGIKQIGGLEFQNAVYFDEIQVKGLTKINGDLIINDNSSIKSFLMQDVTEITGDIITAGCAGLTDKKLEFASITKIGGYIRLGKLYKTSGYYGEEISFPNLKSAGGVSILVNTNVAKISMPQLTSVSDSLAIISPIIKGNTVISDFDSFDKLTNVKTIHIENMNAITSYKGFKNCLNALISEDQWVLTNNRYTPSLDDMKAGRWDE